MSRTYSDEQIEDYAMRMAWAAASPQQREESKKAVRTMLETLGPILDVIVLNDSLEEQT